VKRKVALVSGAGRGIGRAIALALARDGFALGICDRDPWPLGEVAAEIEAMGGPTRSVICDVDDREDCFAAVESVLSTYGHVDALVTCAGQAASGRSILSTPVEEPLALFSTHVLGAFHLLQAALPAMREQRSGSLVAISSATTQLLPSNSGPYSMAKASLDALILTVAKEEARNGIRANVVSPSLVDTRLGHLVAERIQRGLGQAGADIRVPTLPVSAVADAVCFLVSPAAAHISGQRLLIDHFASLVGAPS